MTVMNLGDEDIQHGQGMNDASPRRSRKSNRVRAACQRCQKRKIKLTYLNCDAILPCCGACKKAGVACIDSSRDANGNSARVYITSLQHRVRWLERIIQDRCPDVDLESGPQISDFHAPDLMNLSYGVEESEPQTEVQGYPSPRGTASTDRSLPSASSHRTVQPTSETQPERLAHEIGLVSVSAGTDPRYIGPSSGYFFAKLVYSAASRNLRTPTSQEPRNELQSGIGLINSLLQTSQAPLPQSKDHALQLSQTYFDTVNRQYPFLHQPSHNKVVEQMYDSGEFDSVTAYQVYMVLAIGATILSRRHRIHISGEGYCASAMKHFDKICTENSLRGVQSLLLLLVYSMHNPSLGINAWYVNYQCLAAVLDLGLQRDLRPNTKLSLLEQEMRTRIFWVIYTFDRTLATIMGRPIGLRDEACEFRLPSDVHDVDLLSTEVRKRQANDPANEITHAIHLFKLAKINSEFKYILHSVSKELPPWTYPRIPDITVWQNDALSRLQEWNNTIPGNERDNFDMFTICKIRYHEMVMTLLRPTPAINNPTMASLKICHQSAVQTLRLYEKLYKAGRLVYTWTTIHSVFLATLTMLYCIRVVPEIANQTKLDVILMDLKASSNILSAIGEHWSDSERSRELLDHIGSAVVSWVVENRTSRSNDEHISSDITEQMQTGSDQSHHNLRAASSSNALLGSQLFEVDDTVMVEPNERATNLDFFSSLADLRWSDPIDFTSNWNFDTFVQDFLTYDDPSIFQDET